ncbi:MAG TPA: dienelactone hydrolase family protein [Polyangia bacterium]|nr:dienelactone hydrolase family protein [Polyangia bacterium]
MAIATETILKTDGFTGYLARPERAKGAVPALLIIQEAWGVDAHIEDVTRRFAAAGYVALAPDLYAHAGKRPEPLSRERLAAVVAFLNEAGPSVMGDAEARARALQQRDEPERIALSESLDRLSVVAFGGARRDEHLATLRAAAAYLRDERQETRGQHLGAVGFCMGGGLSGLLACRDPELGAAVIFYGAAPPAAEIPAIRCPVLGFYGGQDQRLMAQLPALAAAMDAAGKSFQHQVYPGAGHAFFNDGRSSYDVDAARDAFARALTFLRQALAG